MRTLLTVIALVFAVAIAHAQPAPVAPQTTVLYGYVYRTNLTAAAGAIIITERTIPLASQPFVIGQAQRRDTANAAGFISMRVLRNSIVYISAADRAGYLGIPASPGAVRITIPDADSVMLVTDTSTIAIPQTHVLARPLLTLSDGITSGAISALTITGSSLTFDGASASMVLNGARYGDSIRVADSVSRMAYDTAVIARDSASNARQRVLVLEGLTSGWIDSTTAALALARLARDTASYAVLLSLAADRNAQVALDSARNAMYFADVAFNELITHATTADAHLPSQTGNTGKFLKTDGAVSSWADVPNPDLSPYALKADSANLFAERFAWQRGTGSIMPIRTGDTVRVQNGIRFGSYTDARPDLFYIRREGNNMAYSTFITHAFRGGITVDNTAAGIGGGRLSLRGDNVATLPGLTLQDNVFAYWNFRANRQIGYSVYFNQLERPERLMFQIDSIGIVRAPQRMMVGDTLRVGDYTQGTVITPSVVSAYNVRTDSLRLGLGLNMSKQPTASVVAENSVESNISIALQPKGTGAFYLGPKADGTATGGNARGQRAVDLQINRTLATQVASGTNAFAAGSRAVSSGTTSVAIGENVSSNGFATIAIGYSLGAGPGDGATAIGYQLQATALGSTALGYFGGSIAQGAFSANRNNWAAGKNSSVFGMNGLAKHPGSFTIGGNGDLVHGRMQTTIFQLNDTTGNAVADTMTFLTSSDSSGLAPRVWTTDNCMTIDSGFVWTYSALVSARSDVGDAASFKIEGGIKRVGATTSMVGTPTITTLAADATAATWAVTAVADDTNDALHFLVTGAANKLIRWHATVTISMVGF